MLVDSSHPTTRKGWGVWRSAPHCALHIVEIHDTKAAALSAVREMLEKGWGDYFVVRKIEFGKWIMEFEPK